MHGQRSRSVDLHAGHRRWRNGHDHTIACDHAGVGRPRQLLTNATPTTADDFFLSHLHMQLYSGDTALHVAAAAYDTVFARILIEAGAGVGQEIAGCRPIHAAVIGAPGSNSWGPERQATTIRYLIECRRRPGGNGSRRGYPVAACCTQPLLGCRTRLARRRCRPSPKKRRRVVTARSGPSDLGPGRHRIAGGQSRARKDHSNARIHSLGRPGSSPVARQPFEVVEACTSSVNSNPVPLPLPIGRKQRRVVFAAREVDALGLAFDVSEHPGEEGAGNEVASSSGPSSRSTCSW